MRRLAFACLAALVAAGLSIPAAAQPMPGRVPPGSDAARPGPGGHRPDGGMPMMHMHHDHGGRHGLERLATLVRHTKGIVAFYRAELAITAAQEPQWAAFAAVLGDAIAARHAAAVRRAAAPDAATAPDRMDMAVATLTVALDTAKALAGTGKALYAVLTPAQRVLADEFWTHHMAAPIP